MVLGITLRGAGNSDKEGKEADKGFTIEQITAMGNWISVPRGNSERQCRIFLRVIPVERQRSWISVLQLPSVIGSGLVWGINVHGHPVCPISLR